MSTTTTTTTPVAAGGPTDSVAGAGASPDGATPGGRRPGLTTETLALAGVFIAMFAFLAAVFAVGLAARAADEHRALAGATESGSSTAAVAVDVSLTEFEIAPDPLTIPAGTAALNVSNEGTVIHNLSVDGTATPMLEAGDAAPLDVGSLEPGTYTLRCDVSGHEAAGMKATLTVE